jgi:hypothetical protein
MEIELPNFDCKYTALTGDPQCTRDRPADHASGKKFLFIFVILVQLRLSALHNSARTQLLEGHHCILLEYQCSVAEKFHFQSTWRSSLSLKRCIVYNGIPCTVQCALKSTLEVYFKSIGPKKKQFL